MNLILRNKRTLHYVEDTAGRWTAERREARVFHTGLEAILFCLDNKIFEMEILAQFADRRMNFAVPVTDLRDE